MKLTIGAVVFAAALSACQDDETVRGYGGAERNWILTELNGTPFDATATLRFPQAGQIAGDAPCNSYSATMTAPYPWFETGPIAATRRACPAHRAETAFFDALASATLSEVAGATLILSDPTGLSMIFKAAD